MGITTEPYAFSRRTNWPLESNRLTVALESLRQEGVSVMDLTASNPTRCGFSYPQDEILNRLGDDCNLDYEPSARGILNARDAVSAYYREKGFNVSSDQVFLTASTSEAYSYLFRLLANPSDHVLFPSPSYPLFSFLGCLNDVRMENYPLVYDGKWKIDLAGAQNLFCDDTRAFVLVNPNNPTGSFVRRQELEELNLLCAAHNTALISDEVFSDFTLKDETRHVSLVENDSVLTFVLGGVSKTLGLPQMKLSWIVINGPEVLVKKAGARLEVIADTYLSVNTPAQNALEQWLSVRDKIQGPIRERLRKNYSFLKEEVARGEGYSLLNSEGGWYAVLKVPDTYSEEEWALSFLTKDHVFVHPGYFFDFDHEAFMVVSLLSPEDILQEGIRRVLKRISVGEL